MPTILGIYLFIPWLAQSLQSVVRRREHVPATLAIPLLIITAYLLVLPTLNVYLKLWGWAPLANQLDLNFLGGVYGLIVIVGYLVKQGAAERLSSGALLASGLLTYFVALWTQLFCYAHGVAYNVWYNYLPLLWTSFTIFILVSRRFGHQTHPTRSDHPNRIISLLGRYAFAIYLLHNPIRMALTRYFAITNPALKLLLLFIGTTLCSFLIAALLARSSRIAQLLLYIKSAPNYEQRTPATR